MRISQLVSRIIGHEHGAEILRRHMDRAKLGVPFRRLMAYQAAAQEIRNDNRNHVVGMSGVLNVRGQQQLDELGPYRSRGHGRGSPLGRGYQLVPNPARKNDRNAPELLAIPVQRSKYVPHQGKRERDRRLVGGYGYARRAHAFYLTEPYSREHS